MTQTSSHHDNTSIISNHNNPVQQYITTLIGEELEGDDKWRGTLVAPNSSVYGITFKACQVVKFNPVNKSITFIGPDFGDGWKWFSGAITERSKCIVK